MIQLEHRTTGDVALVESTDGYDLTVWRVAASGVPDPNAARLVWDRAAKAFVPRAPRPAEVTAAAIEADARWAALRGASPEQIDAWLATNVQTLQDARRVLRLLILAVQTLARTRE